MRRQRLAKAWCSFEPRCPDSLGAAARRPNTSTWSSRRAAALEAEQVTGEIASLIDLGGTVAFAAWVGLEVRAMRTALVDLVSKLATIEERTRDA